MTVRELAAQLKLEVCCGAAGLDKRDQRRLYLRSTE